MKITGKIIPPTLGKTKLADFVKVFAAAYNAN
jgi:hypothetical protein